MGSAWVTRAGSRSSLARFGSHDVLCTVGAGQVHAGQARFTARLGRPGEIASVVAFLAGDDAGWITAQNIRVNGGTI